MNKEQELSNIYQDTLNHTLSFHMGEPEWILGASLLRLVEIVREMEMIQNNILTVLAEKEDKHE